MKIHSYFLRVAILAVFITSAQAQAVFVPGGTVGTSSNNNVGIGTSNPSSRLTVTSGTTSDDIVRLVSNSGGGSFAGIRFEGGSPGGWALAAIRGVDADSFNGDMIFLTDGDGVGNANLVERVRIKADGKVGIGTSSPGFQLDVKGRIRLRAVSTSTAGLWLFNGTADVGFVGDANSGSIGLWGNTGAGWGLVMNTTTGNVGIGTSNPEHRLAVNGTVRAKEVIVETSGWADEVLAMGYRLAPLAEVEAHIKSKGTLPGIPSANEVANDGLSVGEMQAKLLAKVEEVTLHLIAQQKQIDSQERRIEQLIEENAKLRNTRTSTSD